MDYKEQTFCGILVTKNRPEFLTFYPSPSPSKGTPWLKLDNSIRFEFPIAENPRVSKMIEK
jgi:hypothetical protein